MTYQGDTSQTLPTRRDALRVGGLVALVGFSAGTEACAKVFKPLYEERMISIDELFSNNNLTPVSSCLNYRGVNKDTGIHAFDYPRTQPTDQDTTQCTQMQFKDFGNALGLTDDGMKHTIILYVKNNFGIDIKESELEVARYQNGQFEDVYYRGKDRRVRGKNLVGIGDSHKDRRDHIKMLPGTALYVAESDLETEKISRLRVEGYELKKRERIGSRRDFLDLFWRDKKKKEPEGDVWIEPQ